MQKPKPFREKLGIALVFVVGLIFGLPQFFGSTPNYERAPDRTIIDTDSGNTKTYYKGYECTQDCSGHEAGYDWAMDKGICDPDDCGGNSRSFIEGCRAAARDCSY